MFAPHNQAEALTLKNPRYVRWVKKFTTQELESDVGKGDRTTELLFPKSLTVKAKIFSRGNGVFAGRQEIEYFLRQRRKKAKLKVEFFKEDGDGLQKAETILVLQGDIREILKIERTILNLIGRMSGVATLTARVVKKAKDANSNVLVTPTRKTLWGRLDKRACVLGGGGTHRLSLENAVLIKDNHLAALRSGLAALAAKEPKDFSLLKKNIRFFEIEVGSAEEAFMAAEIFTQFQCSLTPGQSSAYSLKNQLVRSMPFFVMLDNVSPEELKKAIHLLRKNGLRDRVGVEVSGGITEKNISTYAKTGVDIISVGSLTHSAPMLDVSLEVIGPSFR